ncbi:MAG TPA: hypothetical protein VHU87_13325 [Rhizomicrobium sp.]|jgi:hypothetical protein|nr:hypothetical protein [Rhizomicrobium sp.]
MSDKPPVTNVTTRLGPWGWFALVVLAGFLISAVIYAVHAWNSFNTTVSPAGWAFMILGAVFTILIGGGLMALVFYSSRHDYDR